MIISNTYILSPSGKPFGFNGKRIMEKKYVYQVKLINTSQWATFAATTYNAFPGLRLTIPVDYVNNADYTYISATDAVVTSEGVVIDNVSSDMLITISDAKIVLTVVNNDTEAISSISPELQHVEINSTASCSIGYNDGFNYNHVAASLGTITADGLSVPVGTQNTTVSVIPNMLTVSVVNNNVQWASTQSNQYQARYGNEMSIPVQYTDNATSEYLAQPVSTDVNGTLNTGVSVGASSFTVPDGIVHGGTITMSPARVQVKPSVQTAYVESISPEVSYVTPGQSATFTLTYASGHSSADLMVSEGTVTNNTYTVPTSSGNWYSAPAIMERFAINGRSYPTLTMGDQIWMAENLDFAWSGLTISSTNGKDPRATYYKGDQYTYGYNGQKWGLIYNGYALRYFLEHFDEMNIPTGWRIPTINDWVKLLTFIGCTPYSTTTQLTSYKGPVYDLYATDSIWQNYSSLCTDLYGMHIVPSPRWKLNTNSFDYGQAGFWTSEKARSDEQVFCRFDKIASLSNYGAILSGSTYAFGYNIRLVRDA